MDIVVEGHHRLTAPPDEGTVHLVVRAETGSKPDALRAVVAATGELRCGLENRELGADDAPARWSIGPVRTDSWRPAGPGGEVLPPRHAARAEVTATFTDAGTLARWCAEVARRPEVELGHVEWDVTAEHRTGLEDRALSGAVVDARRRAVVIAAAAGRGDVAPLEVSDPGLLHTPAPTPGLAPMRAMAEMAGGQDSAPLDPDHLELRPADVEIRVAVHARFRTTE